MKTLKILNCGLLVLAAMCAVTAVFAFVKGDIMHGVSNILWMGCEIIFFSINKESIEIKQRINRYVGFLSYMNDTIEEYGSAIITENEDGTWEITAGEQNNPSCSAENNDNIEFVHNAEGGKE